MQIESVSRAHFFLLSVERVLTQPNDQKFSQSNDLYPVPPLPRTKFPTGQRDGQPWNENELHLPLRACDVLGCEPVELPPKISILSRYLSISLPQRNTR